jgi:hypothetical protein
LIYINKNKNKPAADTNDQTASDNGNVKGATDNTTGTESNDYKAKLAKFLTQKGMVMYGAYWCTHCKDQKETFGDAFQFIDYVECDAGGPNGNPDECKAKGVEGYPTWIYQGQKYPGVRSLSELAGIVGFSESSADQSPNSTDPPANSGDNQQ